MMARLLGEPSPQSMMPVKSASVATGLASVKVPTGSRRQTGTPVLADGVSCGTGGERGVGDDRGAADGGDRAACHR